MTNDTCGLVIFRHKGPNNKIQLLVIKRRCSYAFGDFVTGAYDARRADWDKQLRHRLSHMTIEEKSFIDSLDFHTIYYKYSLSLPMTQLTQTTELEKYKTRLNKFNQTFINNDVGEHLRQALRDSSHLNLFDLFEFPKGRPTRDERAIDAAIRETLEETNISPEHYKILNPDEPLRHNYTGADDHRDYKRLYFFARLEENRRLHTDVAHSQRNQRLEIDMIDWLDLDFLEAKLPLYATIYQRVRHYVMNESLTALAISGDSSESQKNTSPPTRRFTSAALLGT